MGEVRSPLLGNDLPGSTPLDEEDLEGLIPQFITTRRELFDAEFRNITEAYTKYLTSSRKFSFSMKNLYKVHKDMFEKIWKWAGAKRKTNKNIGVDKTQIDVELKKLLDDFEYWEKESVDPIEVSAKLHYRLVAIHPFNNGNGRWARFIASIYLKQKTRETIQWPDDEMRITTEFRKQYIQTLVEAGKHNYKPLIQLHKEHLS
ncbi:MAG: mobile mystery protein B [Candidatus Margulisbacteria bacterium]|nr:mobile mystery protein B [Candidatus Margulisiibacteriota bacterium]